MPLVPENSALSRKLETSQHLKLQRSLPDATSSRPLIGLLRGPLVVALIGLSFSVLTWVGTAAWQDPGAETEFTTGATAHLASLQEGFKDFGDVMRSYHGFIEGAAGATPTSIDDRRQNLVGSAMGAFRLQSTSRASNSRCRSNLRVISRQPLAESGLPARRLELELTESVLMEASRGHNETLLRLRNIGHHIAIDDFGCGYSSLDYLRRYPIDRIKIAQSFTLGIGKDSGSDTNDRQGGPGPRARIQH